MIADIKGNTWRLDFSSNVIYVGFVHAGSFLPMVLWQVQPGPQMEN